MRKAKAKAAFEQMFDDWERELGITITAEHDPSFSDFCSWAERKHFSHYFNQAAACRDDAELEMAASICSSLA
ncbi:hypothetical protein [Bradyrhizobium sp. LM2.3]